jgi:hypothetical protein
MFRRLVVNFLWIASCVHATTNADGPPFVFITLPRNIPSETVQIAFFSIGPFGGYGGYNTRQSGVTSYQIPAVVDGKAASEIRAIVYSPGCAIKTFVIPLNRLPLVWRDFECQRVDTVRLLGQIAPQDFARHANAELVFTYMAQWSHEFFGIGDGAITQFELAKVAPTADGTFDVELPVIRREDSGTPSQSTVCLMLRDSKTLNPVAFNLELDNAKLRSQEGCLQTRSTYPIGLKFTATRFNQSTMR